MIEIAAENNGNRARRHIVLASSVDQQMIDLAGERRRTISEEYRIAVEQYLDTQKKVEAASNE